MLSKNVQKAMNEQINAELYSSYLYLSMSAHFSSVNLNGFANWMRIQAQEELMHAMKFYDHVNEREGRVMLKAIEGPQVEWGTPLEIFEAVYKHEQHVTGLINSLVSFSMEEKDFASNSFLQWFVDEQVEEESTASDLVEQIRLVGESKGGLFMLDRELGQRVFTPPAAAAE
jgi:ferritin